MDLDRLIDRHLTRAFDPTRTIPEGTLQRLLRFLRSAPSSVNIQPWHFYVMGSAEAKQRLADHLGAGFTGGNGPRIRQASHAVVVTTRAELPASHVEGVFAQETADERFPDPENNAQWQRMVREFLDLRTYGHKDITHWMEKQTYLAVGMTMMAAAELGVDATPLEGFDPDTVDAEFKIREAGYTSTVLLALGYADPEHAKHTAPSRLPADRIFTFV